jgi:hypothetical protein
MGVILFWGNATGRWRCHSRPGDPRGLTGGRCSSAPPMIPSLPSSTREATRLAERFTAVPCRGTRHSPGRPRQVGGIVLPEPILGGGHEFSFWGNAGARLPFFVTHHRAQWGPTVGRFSSAPPPIPPSPQPQGGNRLAERPIAGSCRGTSMPRGIPVEDQRHWNVGPSVTRTPPGLQLHEESSNVCSEPDAYPLTSERSEDGDGARGDRTCRRS